jgi:hypothetical protein
MIRRTKPNDADPWGFTCVQPNLRELPEQHM